MRSELIQHITRLQTLINLMSEVLDSNESLKIQYSLCTKSLLALQLVTQEAITQAASCEVDVDSMQ